MESLPELSKVPTAFISMSLSAPSRVDSTYRAIRSACTKHGVEVVRVDDLEHSENIVSVVSSLIQNANLVVADLSTGRPNVFHEIGYADGLSKYIVLIAKAGTAIPQVLTHRKVTFWSRLSELEERLSERLSKLPPRLLAPWKPTLGASVSASSNPRSVRTGLDRDTLLEGIATNRIPDVDSGRTIAELPKGVFGFTVAHLFYRCIDASYLYAGSATSTATNRPNLELTLNANSGGSAFLEVVYSLDGELFVILAISVASCVAVQDCAAGDELSISCQAQQNPEYPVLILVPQMQILAWRERNTPVGCMFDIVIRVYAHG